VNLIAILMQILVSVVAALIVGVVGHYISFDYLSDVLFPDYFMSSYFTIWEIAQYVLVFLGVAGMLKLSKDWFLLKSDQLALEQEHHTVQLDALKSKINPHFLFNSLNNIYALSEEDPSRSRNYILKLSDALRYMIYETDEEKVPLQTEIDYLSDYVELEKLRLDKKAQVNFAFTSDSSELIAPLILLPLVENSFKYVDKLIPVVDIKLELKEGVLKGRFQNSYNPDISHKTGGLGLSTLRKRLQLLYKAKYEYSYEEEGKVYTAHLSIDLR